MDFKVIQISLDKLDNLQLLDHNIIEVHANILKIDSVTVRDPVYETTKGYIPLDPYEIKRLACDQNN
ncbi:hypothetical protein O9G_002906 [Rozella allomycis CSF55]|uniref:Uncharacterized protein n=1 Tax=Rozella allomycis (strain CSF55) TaxID=988480 RepID=A0A075B4R2_ROZAC|nr:hypothetical protein O9G_002906 [Rozella allomycis CSF55]|eukprot:EPZ36404.1 hypothetical protein O9G_002906 [Rozella allomycis CSF55]